MITLSNGHKFEYMTASGAMGFDGKGWLWDWPLIWLGLIKPELFTIVLRTITLQPRPYPISNLSWIRPWTWLPFSPWSCVKLLPDHSTINKIGLYNPGFEVWLYDIAHHLDFRRPLVASFSGTKEELIQMVTRSNHLDFVAYELNVSCPNTGHVIPEEEMVIDTTRAVAEASRHPVILKLSAAQKYLIIVAGVKGYAEAISINSVPWDFLYPDKKAKSPLWNLGGGGGVSGKKAQAKNWGMVKEIAERRLLPVIAPSVMEFADLPRVARLGADAVAFGAIKLPEKWKPWTCVTNPCKPTRIVKRMGKTPFRQVTGSWLQQRVSW